MCVTMHNMINESERDTDGPFDDLYELEGPLAIPCHLPTSAATSTASRRAPSTMVCTSLTPAMARAAQTAVPSPAQLAARAHALHPPATGSLCRPLWFTLVPRAVAPLDPRISCRPSLL
jgi:hypothetical protein